MSNDEPEVDKPQADEVVEERPEPAEQRYRLRRAPKYYPFGITGLALGVIIGLVIGSLPSDPVPDQETFTAGSVLAYFVVAFGLVGVLLGLGLALLVERRQRRRRR